MKGDFPRLLLSGTNSGCGKTTIFCALLQALKDRGEDVAAFKCGPDYIDPMFHRAVIGAESGNLDSYFCGEHLSAVFADSARDLNLIEGAMGYYDGLGFTDEHSAYDVADACTLPPCSSRTAGAVLFPSPRRCRAFCVFARTATSGALFSTAFRAVYTRE